MSTKIYDGYRIKNLTIQNFKETYSSICSYIEKESKKNIMLHLSKMYYEVADNIYNCNPENVLNVVKKELEHEVENLKEGSRSPELDKDIGFYMKEYKGDLYLYLFYEDSDIKNKLLDKLKGIEDFGYWNNTDKPEEISDSHWEKRKKIWNELLTSYSFSKSDFEEFYFFNSINYLEKLSFKYSDLIDISLEERKENYAFRQAVSIVDSKLNGTNFESFKFKIYMRSERAVKEGKHEDLKSKLKKFFMENHQTVSEENFYSLEKMKRFEE